MDASLNIAIAAEFDLCEKIAEALEQSELDVGKNFYRRNLSF